MALIGEIITKIKVDSSQQKRELSKAKKGLMKFEKGAQKAFKGIKAGFASMAVGVGVFTAAMVKSAASIDHLAKTSEKLGIASQELEKLHFQAGLTGVETRTLDMALQRMVRRVSEAASGTGEAVNALKELGINAERLNSLSPDKQFAKIAQAMKKVGDQKDRVRLSFKLFDSEGVALVNTLNSNLDKSGELFNKLGTSLSSLDVKNVEKMNDSWTETKTILEGVANKTLARLSPEIDKVISKFNEWAENGGAKRLVDGLTDNITAMINQFERVKAGIKFMRADFADFFEFMGSGYDNITQKTIKWADAAIPGYAKAKQLLGDMFEIGESMDLRALSGIQFGAQAGKGRPSLFNDPAASSISPTNLNANRQQPTAPTKIELLIKSDPGAAVEVLKQDKVIDGMVMQIIREESAKLGR